MRRAVPQAVSLTLLLGLSFAAGQAASSASTGTVSTGTVGCQLPPEPLPSRTRAVFILDSSGSMRGIGDGKANIFERVKASVNTYVRQQRPDRVELLSFDTGVRFKQGFDQPAAPSGAGKWNAALGSLKADGRNTYLYRSIRAALEPLNGASGSGAEEYVTTVFVLTDGIDNDREKPFTPAQALEAFKERGPLDRLHYLALGTDIPAAAQQALKASNYADGLALPVGVLPDLTGMGGGVVSVTDPEQVKVPLPDGALLGLDAGQWNGQVKLAAERTLAGLSRLQVNGEVPYGTPALLCATLEKAALGSVAAKPSQVLLRLNLSGSAPLVWLNPGADLRLARGEDVVLRYRAGPSVDLSRARLGGLTQAGRAALVTELLHQPGAQELQVRLTNQGLSTGQVMQPSLLLPGLPALPLPVVHGAAGGRTPQIAKPAVPTAQATQSGNATSTPTPATSVQGRSRFPRRLVWLLLGLLALALLVAVVVVWRRRPPRLPELPRLPKTSVPTVQGIEYSEDRTLSLVSAEGDVTGVPTPLGGKFDLGQLARVPLLSGLKAEQHRDGLRITRLPNDLEVSQGARLLRAGDVVRPGTLLGVSVARPDRAPQPPLGTLAGLGLPITLRAEDLTLRVTGPYGEHALALGNGVTDLGNAFNAPVLNGLRVSPSGNNVLLVACPISVTLRRSGESVALRPGTYLLGLTLVDLPET